MKTIITSILALTLSVGASHAAGHNNTVASNNKNAAVVSNSTVLSVMEENRLLKEQVATLANNTEELQSTLEYRQMMGNMLQGLKDARQGEAIEELKAELHYNQMMAAMLMQLQGKKG